MVLPSYVSSFQLQDPLVSAYMRELKRIRPLKAGEEADLLTRFRRGDRTALNALVHPHLRFVVSVAFHYRGRGVPVADLINEGNLGLIRAAERFDMTQGVKFLSYAVWWIRQAITHALPKQGPGMGLTQYHMTDLKKVRQAEGKLTQALGRLPRREELEKETGLRAPAVEAAEQLSLGLFPSVKASREAGDILESIPSPEEISAPDRTARAWLARREAESGLAGLSPREKEVLVLSFGIGREEPASLADIGKRLDLTRERVRQIREKALQRLRRRLASARVRKG